MEQKNALISVFDKTGIVDFVQGLVDLGYIIYSSGGTAKKLRDADIDVIDVATLVGGGAILGHRVVTISRELHAGLLANKLSEADMEELRDLGLHCFDLVCVDCYPLKEETINPDATLESVIEKTDIGGPLMIRSGAKGNRVTVCDSRDRMPVLEWLQDGRPDEEEFINMLAAKAEAYVADYVLTSAMYRGQGQYYGIVGEKIDDLRYGENPQQESLGLFKIFGDNPDPLSIDKFKTIVGKHGHVNWTDVDRGLQTITHIAAAVHKNIGSAKEFYIAVGLKHGNACGAAVAFDEETALENMLDGNLLSIFGGVVITNFPITEALANTIRNYNSPETKRLLDVIVAPSVDEEALETLGRKGDTCKITVNPALEFLGPDCLDKNDLIRPVRGGFLVQKNFDFVLDLEADYITRYANRDILFEHAKMDISLAWALCSTTNSNTVTLVKNGMLIGAGSGQKDRLECCKLAVEIAEQAKHSPSGAVACSDSFFPFPDGPQVLVDAGIKTIFSLSGSIKDPLTIGVCELENVSLIMMPNSLGRMFFGH